MLSFFFLSFSFFFFLFSFLILFGKGLFPFDKGFVKTSEFVLVLLQDLVIAAAGPGFRSGFSVLLENAGDRLQSLVNALNKQVNSL